MLNDSINSVMAGIEQGVATQSDIEALQKALTAGYGQAGKPSDLTGAGVFQLESLDRTLKSVTFDMKNLKMWPAISIDKAGSMIEQYNRITSYGDDSSPYISEGGAGQESDAVYVRDMQKIVFFSQKGSVSHQITLVDTSVGDVLAHKVKTSTMDMLKKVERELYWGNAYYTDAAGEQTGSLAALPIDNISMNGLFQQILRGDTDEQFRSGDFEGYGTFKSVVQDLAGNAITQDDVESLAVILLENFGAPNEIHIEPAALSALVRQFYPQFRSAPGLAAQTVGYDVSKVQTTAGVMDFKPNVFLRPRAKARPQAVNVNCPALPGSFTAAASAGGALAAGAYWYQITEVNDFGESAPRALASAVTATASQKVTLTMPAPQTGTKYFKVYRSAPGAASAAACEFIGCYKVGLSAYVDLGRKLPGLGEAYFLDMNAETMRFKQLLPLSKMNLATVTTASQYLLLLYGALLVFAPRFVGAWKNIGK